MKPTMLNISMIMPITQIAIDTYNPISSSGAAHFTLREKIPAIVKAKPAPPMIPKSLLFAFLAFLKGEIKIFPIHPKATTMATENTPNTFFNCFMQNIITDI